MVLDIGTDVIGKFAVDWWTKLQPEWHKSSKSLSQDIPAGGCDWEATRKGLQNGLYTVVLTLRGWFLGAHNNGHGIEACECALDDMEWVLDQMVACNHLIDSGSLGKRNRGNDKDLTLSNNGKKQRYLLSSMSFFTPC